VLDAAGHFGAGVPDGVVDQQQAAGLRAHAAQFRRPPIGTGSLRIKYRGAAGKLGAVVLALIEGSYQLACAAGDVMPSGYAAAAALRYALAQVGPDLA